MKSMSEFRLQARHVFLTYPQCSIDPDTLYETMNIKHSVKSAIIAQEKHQDGNPHLHALFTFQKKLHTRNPKEFDIGDCHPNIQTPRNIPAITNYIKKDGNYRCYGEETDFDIYKASKTLDHENYFRECLKRKIPFPYAELAWKRNASYFEIDNIHQTQGKIRSDLSNLKLADIEQRGKSTVIIGPTGIGKSTWAKREAPKPALFVSHQDTLRQFDPKTHKSIIFDDMSFAHLPRDAQIHIADQDDTRAIHIRYGIATIPAGTPKIFTANQEIFSRDPAIERRLNKHNFI